MDPFVGDVQPGHYLMMGDNRDNSDDGRRWGYVPEENLVGRATRIWFNWDLRRSGGPMLEPHRFPPFRDRRGRTLRSAGSNRGLAMRNRQQGITAIGWLVLLTPFAIVLYAGIRLAPLYLNYLKVVRAIDVAAEQRQEWQRRSGGDPYRDRQAFRDRHGRLSHHQGHPDQARGNGVGDRGQVRR